MIDNHGTFFTRGVGVQQRSFRRDCRQAFVLKSDGDFGQCGQIACECAGGLATRTLTAIHIERQAQNDAANLAACAKLQQLLGVRCEFAAPDGLQC